MRPPPDLPVAAKVRAAIREPVMASQASSYSRDENLLPSECNFLQL
jgi:hypothetical protein